MEHNNMDSLLNGADLYFAHSAENKDSANTKKIFKALGSWLDADINACSTKLPSDNNNMLYNV